jgi:hypothetical protein
VHEDVDCGSIRMSLRGSSIRTPQGKPRGETESRFWGVCRVSEVGLTVRGFPTDDAWSFGLRRHIDLFLADEGWSGTKTPRDVRACIAILLWSGRFLQGDQESLRRPEHLFIQPEILGVAVGSLRTPTTLETMWARHSAYPSPTWQTCLQFSTPKGYGF